MYIAPFRNYTGAPMKKGHITRGKNPETEGQKKFVPQFPYSEIVGDILYLSVVTRMDIAFAVGLLTRHMKTPTHESCLLLCVDYLSTASWFTCLH